MDRNTKIKLLHRFEEHLTKILPMYAVSNIEWENEVVNYAIGILRHLKREVSYDAETNIISQASSNRVIVAHTDTVGYAEKDLDKRHQRIKYNPQSDIIYNVSKFRPMGGDDKVGVAAALAIAEFMPHINVWLPSDEEVGCEGSRKMTIPAPLNHSKYILGVQLDRRGALDLTQSICGATCADNSTIKALHDLLPHRKIVSGATTDVGTFLDRSILQCGFNLSCGYHDPHCSTEFIKLSEAHLAVLDGINILEQPDDIFVEAKNKRGGGYIGNRPKAQYLSELLPGGNNTNTWEDSDTLYNLTGEDRSGDPNFLVHRRGGASANSRFGRLNRTQTRLHDQEDVEEAIRSGREIRELQDRISEIECSYDGELPEFEPTGGEFDNNWNYYSYPDQSYFRIMPMSEVELRCDACGEIITDEFCGTTENCYHVVCYDCMKSVSSVDELLTYVK